MELQTSRLCNHAVYFFYLFFFEAYGLEYSDLYKWTKEKSLVF